MMEVTINRFTGNMRWLETIGPVKPLVLQQEFEITTRLMTGEFVNAEKSHLEWRDVATVMV